jgi:hypothetical protein
VAQEQDKTIFPVRIDGDVLPQLTARQYLDLSDAEWPPTDWIRAVQEQVRSAQRRRVARELVRVIAIALPAGAALVLLALSITPLVRHPRPELPILNGDYNLGVAQFTHPPYGNLPESIQGELRAFEPAVVAGVQRALDQSPVPVSADVELLRIVVGELPVGVKSSGEDAESVASQSNADALLYGTITTDGASIVVSPVLWLSPRALSRAEELYGPHALPVAREDLSRPDAAIRLRRLIADTASDLAQLTQIVRLYDAGGASEALGAVRRARERGFAQEGLLDIFEGNLAGKLGHSDEASVAYERALTHVGYQGRARLGLTQVKYSAALDAQGGCGPDVNVDALVGLLDEYPRLQAEADPPGANIDMKAIFGEGRTRMCLDASGHRIDDGAGRRLLEQVIAAHMYPVDGRPDGDLQELAAEAEGLLGDHDGRWATNSNDLRAALDHLARAAELTTFSDRRSAFDLAQAAFLARAGDVGRACAKLAEARLLAPQGSAPLNVPNLQCS